jgi:hypothetical protein
MRAFISAVVLAASLQIAAAQSYETKRGSAIMFCTNLATVETAERLGLPHNSLGEAAAAINSSPEAKCNRSLTEFMTTAVEKEGLNAVKRL